MHLGLAMDLEERRDRWNSLHKKVTANTARRFCTVFLSHLGRSDLQPERPALRAIS
jgi:trehalose-6-phosphate synthase